MNLYEKIKEIYPLLDNLDFIPVNNIIILQNDGDGDYIKEWNHSTFVKPTEEQLS
jgi:uncharacterized protein (UPF0297 family)